MPKFQCKCGHLFRLGRVPADDDYVLVPDETVASLPQRESWTAEEMIERIDNSSRQVLLCPTCGRLWLEDTQTETSYIEYTRQ